MPTLSVCSNCRSTCPKCHNHTNASHPVWVCMDCMRKYDGKCCVCGGKRSAKGTSGAGKVCNSCHKINTCTLCGKHI